MKKKRWNKPKLKVLLITRTKGGEFNGYDGLDSGNPTS